MSTERTCPQCAAPLPDDAPDRALCPACASSATRRTVIDSAPVEPVLASDALTVIGDFEIIEKLGAGGMGAVYKARQITLDRLVALKVLPSQFADDPDYIGRFQREAKVASALHHPNLVSVYNYGSADGVHYIAMELVEGENLHQLLRHRTVDMAEALSITDYVAQGLKRGWETAQLVHRDIKPSNIYLSYDGHVKVGDLGLAKSLMSNTTGITQTGTMMGTPHYMSPEQCRGDKHIDFRADIYSLGCMLFEMLTQHPPYPGSDPVAIVHKHLNAPPPALLKALPGCPLPLALLVGRMLKKSPRERHASYDELIAEIEALYEHIERGEQLDITQFRRPAQRTTPATTVSEGTPEWVFWAGAALAAVALVVVFLPKRETKLPVAAATPAATPRASPIAAATAKSATPATTPAPASTDDSGSWRQLFDPNKWVAPAHMHNQFLFRTEQVADQSIRSRIRWQGDSAQVGLFGRSSKEKGGYQIEVFTRDTVRLVFYLPGSRGENSTVLGTHTLPKPLQPGDAVLLELHVQGDRLTGLVDGAVVIEARDSRRPDPGVWGIFAGDGWYETVEVQTPLPAGAVERWQNLLADKSLANQAGGKLNGQAVEFPRGGWVMTKSATRDGAVRMRAAFTGKPGFALLVRGHGEEDRYSVRLQDARTVKLYMLHESKTTTLREVTLPQPLAEGSEFLLELRIVGSLVSVALDGTQLVALEDTTVSAPGKFGVGTYSEVAAAIQSLEFLDLDHSADDGWEDLFAQLTPELVAQTGKGWRLEGGVLHSPDQRAALPLPGTFAGTSYQVRIKLRKLSTRDVFNLALPIGDRMTGFELEGFGGQYTGLNQVNGADRKAVKGTQIKDAEWHDLEVTVRLEGINARITTMLDTLPLYEWTGPVAVLGPSGGWGTPAPGLLAFGAVEPGWEVSEVKVKRLGASAAPAKAGAVLTFGGHRYQLVREALAWDAAKATAEAMGGHLATITSQEENEWILNNVERPPGPSPHLYIGGTRIPRDDRGGKWQWVTGEPVDLNLWGGNGPDGSGPALTVFYRGTDLGTCWDDVGDNQKYSFLVEWDGEGAAKLANVAAATKDAPFVNSLGMKFVPVPIVGGPTAGKTVLFSVWETRVQDYQAFATETKRAWQKAGFEQGPTHPSVNVSWDDTTAFCAWLTERERKAGRLGANDVVRLPKDHEWSCAVGIGDRDDGTKLPGEKNDKIGDVYPWGTAWPPPPGAGNYGGKEVQPLIESGAMPKFRSEFVLGDNSDDFQWTAPVGSFAANAFGIYDLGGNVWELCEEANTEQTERIQRGASYYPTPRTDLRSARRTSSDPAKSSGITGFRCVVELATPPTAASAPPASAADGWEDLFAKLTPEVVAQTGHGWSLKDGVLRSPRERATVPMPGNFTGASYQARIKLRPVALNNGFIVILPVADRRAQFVLDNRYPAEIRSGVQLVNGKPISDVPGTVQGQQVKDTNSHDLEVSVRLDGANAKISAALDARPIYEWSGPFASLDIPSIWKTSPRGSLALGNITDDWEVSAVKVQRLGPPTPGPPAASAPAAPAADGWEDLFAKLTPELVAQTGHGWSLKDGVLSSPAKSWATLPLPGNLSSTSYQVRVKLRQLTLSNNFHVSLPVGDRVTGFDMDVYGGKYTGLQFVDRKRGKDMPGVVEGKQVKDSEPHDLQVTVRLDGANAIITATLDGQALYEWAGLITALSMDEEWGLAEPGALALGTLSTGWAVSAVKVKRLGP